MPDSHERSIYVRILEPLQLRVAFATASFEVQLRSITAGANKHGCVAYNAAEASCSGIGPDYLDRKWLEQAAFKVGLKVRCATVGETIARRLVREGRAEVVPKPVDDLEYKPARHSDPIWAPGWFNADKRD